MPPERSPVPCGTRAPDVGPGRRCAGRAPLRTAWSRPRTRTRRGPSSRQHARDPRESTQAEPSPCAARTSRTSPQTPPSADVLEWVAQGGSNSGGQGTTKPSSSQKPSSGRTSWTPSTTPVGGRRHGLHRVHQRSAFCTRGDSRHGGPHERGALVLHLGGPPDECEPHGPHVAVVEVGRVL